jgi:hypothetical protein
MNMVMTTIERWHKDRKNIPDPAAAVRGGATEYRVDDDERRYQ